MINNRCYYCGGVLKEYINNIEFSINQCKSCKIAATDPAPPSDIDYKELVFNPNKIEDNLPTKVSDLPIDWQDALKQGVLLIKKNFNTNIKILEIGCGEGIFLDELRKEGYSVKGIEPSLIGSSIARSRGLDVKTGYFDIHSITENFDLVIMSQVLEHIKDPSITINLIKKTIPNGYLLLTQTNYKGLYPLLTRSKWYAWVPEQHFWHFTIDGLTKYLSGFGFEKIDFQYTHLVHPHRVIYILACLRNTWKDQFTVLYKLNSKS